MMSRSLTGFTFKMCNRFVISQEDLGTLEDLVTIVFSRAGMDDCSLEEVGLEEFLDQALKAAKLLPQRKLGE